ncbi:MAG: HAMP domain-containing protein [Myxococcales bacterium]|nr:HAMP domain-containing protein [Myxococcales bacterium]
MQPRRRTRRYLVDARFQLKYTGMLVGVVLSVMVVLGVFLFQTARAASTHANFAADQAERALKESAASAKLLKMNASYDEALGKSLDADLAALDAEYKKNLDDVQARRKDVEQQRQRLSLLLALGSLVLLASLSVMGIFITHRIVGPVYRMKRLLRQVGTARFSVKEKLRRGDELEDLFETFVQTVHSLEALQAGRRLTLDATIEKARKADVPADVMHGLEALHAQLSLGLGGGVPASKRDPAKPGAAEGAS